MKKRFLLPLWGGLFALCAGLGFLPEPEGALSYGMTAVSVLFFVPPVLLLLQAKKCGNRHTVLLIRNLSFLSLCLSAVLLVLNFLSAMGSETLGTILYYVLIIVSSPMICSGYWALSLFLWACLLMYSRQLLKTEL